MRKTALGGVVWGGGKWKKDAQKMVRQEIHPARALAIYRPPKKN